MQQTFLGTVSSWMILSSVSRTSSSSFFAMRLTPQNCKILIARKEIDVVSDKKISEKGIASAAELLYKGAKMLAHSCPECKMPLFEKDGRVFCPSCGREVIIEENAEAIRVQAESEKRFRRSASRQTRITMSCQKRSKVHSQRSAR